jgi:hypothetical protein
MHLFLNFMIYLAQTKASSVRIEQIMLCSKQQENLSNFLNKILSSTYSNYIENLGVSLGNCIPYVDYILYIA